MAPSMSVAEYYAGKSIFITGATGFMGKVLVEKLLRCCPDIENIYLLLRSKKGKSCKERLEEFGNCRVFERLLKERPKALDKLQIIAGDILAEDLGISVADREMLQKECQIVFHCAACVRFDMSLRDALNLNTVGTKRVLQLAEGMKRLEVFQHVSTAYCRCDLDLLEEKLYPTEHRPQDVMDCVGWMNDDLVKYMQPKLIDPQPNTYAYTKALTEDLISQYAGKFPIAIARPSIVIAAHEEPMPGWVDNLNGPTGLIVGAGKGVIRTMHCNGDYRADVVPVDIVVNGCIVLGYTTGIDKPNEVRVCNITESGLNPITWSGALDMGRVHVKDYPFSVTLWYPGGSPKSSLIQHRIALFFCHLLPAYFIDLLLFLLGKKTFMVKVQKRITYGLNVLQYYTTKEWYFKNDNFLSLRKNLSKEDNETFYMDIKVIDWSMYMRNYIKGAREYCLKEDPANLPKARKLIKRLYYADVAVKVLFYAFCLYFLYCYLKAYLF